MPQKLTERAVKALKPPLSGDTKVWDSELSRFGVRVFAPTRRHPQGTRSFFVDLGIGRERLTKIGRFPNWSAEAARAEAKGLLRRIDRGEDPAADRRARREAPTVADLAERYRTEHLPKKAASSRKNDWAMIRNDIVPRLGSRKVVEVHDGDMAAFHRDITLNNGPKRANRQLSVASKMFSLAMKPIASETVPWRDHVLGNPCRGVERNPEEGRERFFSQTELAALSDALAAYGPKADSDCITFIELCGCRPGEAMPATWDQFDVEPGFWVKPSATTKQRRVHKVPLGPAALELLARIRKAPYDPVRVFPVRTLKHAWKKISEAAGLSGTRVYDLRHTFASVGAGGGLSLQIIGRLLGHTQARTTQRYAHLSDSPLREAVDKISAEIANAGKPAAEIVPLKRGGPR